MKRPINQVLLVKEISSAHTEHVSSSTYVVSATCCMFFVDFLMGHQLDGTHDAYYRANPISLREKFENFIPWLTIKKELNVTESPEFKKMKHMTDVIIKENAKLTVENADHIELRKKIDSVEEQNKQLQEMIKSNFSELVDARVTEL